MASATTISSVSSGIGDVVLIFCSLRQMQQVQVEVWQRDLRVDTQAQTRLDPRSLSELKALCKARRCLPARTKMDMIFALQEVAP